MAPTSTVADSFPAVSLLEQTPRTLAELLATATAGDLEWQPRPERWSIAMVLAHLADVEKKGFVSRFRAMTAQENPRLPAYDQLALFRTGAHFEGLPGLEKFREVRASTLGWLRMLPAEVMDRTGHHEELGPVTFGELLHEFVFHDLGHIRQIMELYRARVFYPHMGVFQGYYRINP